MANNITSPLRVAGGKHSWDGKPYSKDLDLYQKTPGGLTAQEAREACTPLKDSKESRKEKKEKKNGG